MVGRGAGWWTERVVPRLVDASLSAAPAVVVRRTGPDGERLAAPDGSYDAVLCTFTSCTVPDPVRALAEVRRVLRPGGSLHLLEHGAVPQPRVRAWQWRLEPVRRRVVGDCHLTRDVLALVHDTGLEPDGSHQVSVAGGPARPWSFVTVTRARRDTDH